MKGEILGIPLLLLIPAIVTILAVDVPAVMLHSDTVNRVQDVQIRESNTQEQVARMQQALVNPSPTATPSATPTPTKAVKFTVPTTSSK